MTRSATGEGTRGSRLRIARAVLCIGSLGAALAAAPTAAADPGQIYRCEATDGTLIFADRPCDEQVEPVEWDSEGGGGFSVVASPDNLAAVAESNARYLEQRRSDRAERMQAERDAQRTERLQRQAVPPMILPVPVYVDPLRRTMPEAPAAATERMRRLQQADDRFPSATDERRTEGSVLTGRQLGARRRDDDG